LRVPDFGDGLRHGVILCFTERRCQLAPRQSTPKAERRTLNIQVRMHQNGDGEVNQESRKAGSTAKTTGS
jgi:hypothetical protein